MKKCYPIVHTINKSCEGYIHCDIIAVYSDKEQAFHAIDNIEKEIRSGKSTYFPKYVPTIEQITPFGSYIKGLTCQWLSEAQETMFSHFYVREIDFVE